MDSIFKDNTETEKICENMTRAISIIRELNYRFERRNMYDEMQMLREQARCCYYVLAQAQNKLELMNYAEQKIRPEDFNISNLISDLISDASVKIRSKGCGIVFDTDIVRGIYCRADPDRFAACFMNLVVNALQNVDFEEGAIRIVLKKYDSSGVAAVSVIDNGYAMSSADFDRRSRVISTHGFDVLREFCRSVGTEPNVTTKENDGFGVTVKVPLSPSDGSILTFESDARGAGLESFSASSLLLYKLDWVKIIL